MPAWNCGVSGVVFFIALFTIPQSSRFLISKNSLEDALGVIRMMGSENPHGELEEVRLSMDRERTEKVVPLLTRSLSLPLFLAVSIAIFNQVSGINTIFYYSKSMFVAAGMSRMSGSSQSIYRDC